MELWNRKQNIAELHRGSAWRTVGRMAIKRPTGCICPEFTDVGGFRFADLTCPVHGVDGTDPGDGYWETDDAVEAMRDMGAAAWTRYGGWQ